MSLARALLLALMAFLSQSCFSAGYLAQAAGGQLRILGAARPIRDVVARPDTPERTRRLLGEVRSIKAFGLEQGLAPTRSYERYADLGRPAAAWVVQASARLSFDPRRWSFPVVGSVPYLGFFDEAAARRFAEGLAARERLDVDVRTASAFSTLGWFHDPVLSTMLGGGDEALGDLANVVLHESVHATVYLKDQSAFDESLASFVADRITPIWLERALGAESPEAKAWAAAQERARARAALLHRAYVDLDAVYRSAEPDAVKLERKARRLATLREALGDGRPLDNAALAGYRTYDTGVAAFTRLLASCEASWPRFMRAVASLAPSDFARPQQEELDEVIDRLAGRGCPRGTS